jgi:hypothetical protein
MNVSRNTNAIIQSEDIYVICCISNATSPQAAAVKLVPKGRTAWNYYMIGMRYEYL